MHKSGLPTDLNGYFSKKGFFLLCALNSTWSHTLCNNTNIRSVCPCQILLDGFVQTNKRLCPHISLVFSSGIDHLLGGVYQGQQGALKIVLTQLTNMICKVRDEPKYVCQLPGNDLLTDDLQVSCLAEGSQLSILHWKVSTGLKVYARQQDLVDEMKKKWCVFIIEVHLLFFCCLFTDIHICLTSNNRWTSSKELWKVGFTTFATPLFILLAAGNRAFG